MYINTPHHTTPAAQLKHAHKQQDTQRAAHQGAPLHERVQAL
jgi:hypothetical protein